MTLVVKNGWRCISHDYRRYDKNMIPGQDLAEKKGKLQIYFEYHHVWDEEYYLHHWLNPVKIPLEPRIGRVCSQFSWGHDRNMSLVWNRMGSIHSTDRKLLMGIISRSRRPWLLPIVGWRVSRFMADSVLGGLTLSETVISQKETINWMNKSLEDT